MRVQKQARTDAERFAAAIRLLLPVLLFALTILGAAPSHAKYASIVVDADTGEILHAVNKDTRNYPASLTKMMTLYLVFDRLKRKQWTLRTRLKVSHRAARQPASRLGLKPKTTITVKEAILALVTKSANDVATTIAENIAKRERNFALKMTAKARSLGMGRTTFRNASGLPHRAQMSTAHDMGILARALLRDFPEYYHYFSTQSFSYKGHKYRNHNKLLATYDGADGIKTGYIRASGFNLVASATRNGRRLVGVVFGGRSPKLRNKLMTRILDKGFRDLAARHGVALVANNDAAPAKASPPQPTASKKAERKNAAVVEWSVQVGAFNRPSHAVAAAKSAMQRASKYLEGGQIRIVPLKKRNGRIIHRARIEGISKRDAYRTCRVLRDCMEIKASIASELASAERS